MKKVELKITLDIDDSGFAKIDFSGADMEYLVAALFLDDETGHEVICEVLKKIYEVSPQYMFTIAGLAVNRAKKDEKPAQQMKLGNGGVKS